MMTTTINMTGKNTKDVAKNHRSDEASFIVGRTNASLAERISTLIAGTSLSLAFALVGVILSLAVRT